MEHFEIIIIILISVILYSHITGFSKAKRLIREWADRNNFEIVSLNYCWVWTGLFF